MWSYASAHAAFLPDLLFADAVQCPKNWVAGGGAGGIRVPVVVTAVCVVAAVADSVDGSLRQMIMRTVRSVFPLGYTFRIR